MRAINIYIAIWLTVACFTMAIHYVIIMVRERRPPHVDVVPPCLPPPDNLIRMAGQERWIKAAREAAHRIADEKGDVTVDDVWAECPPIEGMDGRIMMAAFPRGEWEVVGQRQSQRQDVNHGRRIAVWKRKEIRA